MTRTDDAIILNRDDVRRLATVDDYFSAIKNAFCSHADGTVRMPQPMEFEGVDGVFHAKGAFMRVSGRPLAVLKLNGNFPLNAERFRLPTIQGAVLLCDGETGVLLAVLDSGEITLRRTAAASAVAMEVLAPNSATNLLVCGCGVQGGAHVEALARLRTFQRIRIFDKDGSKARILSSQLSRSIRLEIEVATNLCEAARKSDVIVTCTPSKSPVLFEEDVRPGAFIAAVGADNPHKNEMAPELMRRAVVIADVADQCVLLGDARAAIAAGTLRRDQIRAQLGEVLTGARPGRMSDEEIIIFDSTGAAFEDLAAAAMIAGRARAAKIGAHGNFAGQ